MKNGRRMALCDLDRNRNYRHVYRVEAGLGFIQVEGREKNELRKNG